MFAAVLCRIMESLVLIEASEIESIEQVSKISPILGLPSFIPGVMQSKSGLLTLIDLEQVMFANTMNVNSASKVILFNDSNKKYGILITEALGFLEIQAEQLGESDVAMTFLREVTSETEEGLRLINLKQLMSYLAAFSSGG